MPATEDQIAQNPMNKHSKKAKVIDFFDACGQKPGPDNASCREAQRLPEIVYLARKRERTRRIGTVEDSLYLLLLAAALGYLLIPIFDSLKN